MADVDELIKRVVDESGNSEEEVRERMSERKEKTHGLLSDYGAIYAVAKEYGIDFQDDGKFTDMADVKASPSISVAGRVKAIFSPREFKKKDGGAGKFASLVLVDKTGDIRLVLWDKATDIIKKLKVGDVLTAKNAYSRENRDGVIEVHVGVNTNLAVNPKIEVDLPEVKEDASKVGELKDGLPGVNITVRVSGYYPKTEFNRADGTTGARASFTGEDETGSIRVVLWDDAADTSISDGDIVRIENAYTRKGLKEGEIELQAGSRSRILETKAKLKLDPLPETKKEEKIRADAVKPGMSSFTIDLRIIRVYEPRSYSGGEMASLIASDKTGSIRVVLWDEKAALANDLAEGDGIRITNAYSKANMSDEPEVHVGKYGNIEKTEVDLPSMDEIEDNLVTEKKINMLENNESYVKITGKIVEWDDRAIIYMTCPGCGARVQNLSGEWMCDTCGDIDPTPNMKASFIIEDDSGNMRALAFKETAEKLYGMDVEEAMNLIGEMADETAPVVNAEKEAKGKVYTLTGRTRYNDYSDQLEFFADKVSARIAGKVSAKK